MKKNIKLEKDRFWLGVFMILVGFVLLFISLFQEPVGTISNSVLGAFGEISLLAGCLLGCDLYVEYKIHKIFREKDNLEKEVEE